MREIHQTPKPRPEAPGDVARRRVEIRGAVQGVGFRPFVYRLAHELGLTGWVRNDAGGVCLEVEGGAAALERFGERLARELPPRAVVRDWNTLVLEAIGCEEFEIRASDAAAPPTAVVLGDGATCAACRDEVLDPADRRHGYPFTNCTHCGPRFTIVEGLPYDRARTTMRTFALCADCRREYEDPLDRRFHAQPNACPACGPQLSAWGPDGKSLAERSDAIERAADALAHGQIVACKGLGGFLLLVNATDEGAVRRLRRRKAREEKPLALMVLDLPQARELCTMSEADEALLDSPQAPIVLLPRRADAAVAPSVAPETDRLGVMLAYTPLYTLLLRAVGRPLVATSGNRSDEPICTDEREALACLGGIADLFLVHDRPIARPVDDSVVVPAGSDVVPIRRARGLAPLPIRLAAAVPPILALGGHLKNTIALAVHDQVFVSQHVGDLETPRARAVFEAVIGDFLGMYATQPVCLAHDLHPDHAPTQWSQDLERGGRAPAWAEALRGVPRVAVQHHHAHLAACLAEHGHQGPALGVTWDGTGHGTDGTVWGGEFLLGDARAYERVAHLRPFRLPGGDAAVGDPRRVAVALLAAVQGDAVWEGDVAGSFTPAERRWLRQMLDTGLNAPWTSSMGRLFDGVAALLGRHRPVAYEGQAAMALEQLADPGASGSYRLELGRGPGVMELDWRPLVGALARDRARGVGVRTLAARFHETLVHGIVGVATEVGCSTVALSGGCFQNVRLATRAREALEARGFHVLTHRAVPPGDGGISLGQVAVAAAQEGGR